MENTNYNNNQESLSQAYFEDMPPPAPVYQQMHQPPHVAPAPPPYHPPYMPLHQPPHGFQCAPPPPRNPVDGKGIASMVLGIVSMVVCFCYGIGLIPALIGLILGCCADKNPYTGKKSGFAISGIIISSISLFLNICWLVYIILSIVALGSGSFDNYNYGYDFYNQFPST